MYTQIVDIIRENGKTGKTYIEPFSGGAGLALKLLIKDDVRDIHLNDSDPAIASFWKICLTDPDYLITRLLSSDVSLDEWDKQKHIYDNWSVFDEKELAFATLFLNRTNRGGVMTAGVNGGRAQAGKTRIDARFTLKSRKTLTKKIQRIFSLRDRILFTDLDAFDLLDAISPKSEECFIFADPPYISKGPALYKNSFTEDHHRTFGKKLQDSPYSYIVSYDAHPLALQIYEECRVRQLSARYSLATREKTWEYLFFSADLTVPSTMKGV